MGDWEAFIKPLLVVGLVFGILHVSSSYEVLFTTPRNVEWMEPTLHGRDVLWFVEQDPPESAIERGTVVIWEPRAGVELDEGEHPLVSRVVALPGDRVWLTPERTFVVPPGEDPDEALEISEPYVGARSDADHVERILIPDGYVYLLNDGRSAARSALRDSRLLGPVPFDAILHAKGGL